MRAGARSFVGAATALLLAVGARVIKPTRVAGGSSSKDHDPPNRGASKHPRTARGVAHLMQEPSSLPWFREWCVLDLGMMVGRVEGSGAEQGRERWRNGR